MPVHRCDDALHTHPRSRPRWDGQRRTSLFAAAVQGSSTIEHITISSTDARALVENAPMSGAVDDETRQTLTGYRDAMTYVRQTPHVEFFEYSETALSALHFMITR